MKKIIMGVVAFIGLALLSWALFFGQKIKLTAHQEGQKIQAQALSNSSAAISTENFLEGLSSSAETQAVALPFTYSNSGTSTARTVYVTVPEGFAAANNTQTYPVCFGFHGTAKSGDSSAKAIAVDNIGSGCIMISPVGGTTDDSMYSWNVTGLTNEDDLAFVQSVWDVIKVDARIDTSRVYAFGHSVGSLFVSNILAVSATFFKGFCCYSSQLMVDTDISSANAPQNIVNFHGDIDPAIPYDGGVAPADSTVNLLSEEATVTAWLQHNGCSQTASIVEQNTTYTKYSSACTEGVVASYIFKNVDHESVPPVTAYFDKSAAEIALWLFE